MRKLFIAAALAGFAALPNGAQADPVADFYKGKQLFMQIGSGTGGGYDLVGRVIARYMGKYVPGNPVIVVQNVPGGGSLKLANQFGNTTKADGTYIGVMSNGMPTTPLMNPEAAHFDPRKFSFIGSTSREIQVLVIWHTAPAKTLDDVFTTEVIAGASSPGSATLEVPMLTNALMGTKFKIIPGYPGATDVKLAMQRGEVHANAALAWGSARTQYADLLKSGELKVIAQYGTHKHPDLPDVPLFPKAKSAADQQMFDLMFARQDYGRPIVTPPKVPADRVAALIAAFDATMKDPGFLAEAAKVDVEVNPVSGKELQELTEQIFKTPPEVVARMRQLLGTQGSGKE
ncbi:MAG TPA: tripartite tricarboxylate transporter substrate-binding protein [Alphaproteobacteria bacterium]|jgi:tripartite-type tricarboxylate transporter receptor subunit TctC